MAGFFKNAWKGSRGGGGAAGQAAAGARAGAAHGAGAGYPVAGGPVGTGTPGGGAAPGALDAGTGYPGYLTADPPGSPGVQAGSWAPGSQPGAPGLGGSEGLDPEEYYRLDLPHGFSRPMNVGVPGEEVPYLSYPPVPADLSPEAAEYARDWWQIWGSMVNGHIDVARAAEAGNIPQAEQLLFNWEQAVQQAGGASQQLGDFQGGRTLVLASEEVRACYAEVVDALHEFIRVQASGADATEAIEDAHIAIGNLHIELNRSVAGFFADPLGTVEPLTEVGDEVGDHESGYEDYGAGPTPPPGSAPGPAAPVAEAADPAFAPVHGITFHDYVAGTSRVQEGTSPEVVCSLLGVTRSEWDAACAEWGRRVNDTYPTTVGAQYVALRSTPHPRLSPEACAAAGTGLPGGAPAAAYQGRPAQGYQQAAAYQGPAQGYQQAAAYPGAVLAPPDGVEDIAADIEF